MGDNDNVFDDDIFELFDDIEVTAAAVVAGVNCVIADGEVSRWHICC